MKKTQHSRKMYINRLDNKNETNDESDDLRHHNSNDLQSTCPKYQQQHLEANVLKIEKETIKEESKKLYEGNQESFNNVYEGSVKNENTELELRDKNVSQKFRLDLKNCIFHKSKNYCCKLSEMFQKCGKRDKKIRNLLKN